jgi:hypothetical protein
VTRFSKNTACCIPAKSPRTWPSPESFSWSACGWRPSWSFGGVIGPCGTRTPYKFYVARNGYILLTPKKDGNVLGLLVHERFRSRRWRRCWYRRRRLDFIGCWACGNCCHCCCCVDELRLLSSLSDVTVVGFVGCLVSLLGGFSQAGLKNAAIVGRSTPVLGVRSGTHVLWYDEEVPMV